MKPTVVTKINPYTGNQLHTVDMVRKEVNGTGFSWKVVIWECQGCLRSHEAPYWCCPKCGGYSILLTEEQYNGKRKRQEDAQRRASIERSTEGGEGDLVRDARSVDEPRAPAHYFVHGRKREHER